MAAERLLDVRGLPPCEPLERILAVLDGLAAGARIRALIDREPRPLFPLLAERGFDWQVAQLDADGCTLLVWRRGDAAAAPSEA
jgi:uncharacterized protein (DUF2249 family)